jgi:hypothetical protein
MPGPTATLDLFAEDVSTQSWEELVEDLLPGYATMTRPSNGDPQASTCDYITPSQSSTSPCDPGNCSYGETEVENPPALALRGGR